jgi:hypothetical protein
MLLLQHIEILAQLVDTLEESFEKFERAYGDTDAPLDKKARDEILAIHSKIAEQIQ